MDIASYFTGLAQTLIARYDMRARMAEHQQIRRLVLHAPAQSPPETQEPGSRPPSDSVEISQAARQLMCARPSCEADEPESHAAPDEKPEAQLADGEDDDAAVTHAAPSREMTVRLRQRLDYGLHLRFDLESIRGTLAQLAEGDSEVVGELSAARLGLSADLRIRGTERMVVRAQEAESDDSEVARLHGRSIARQRRMAFYRAQGSDVDLKAFFREAVRVRESIKVADHDGHVRAVRKFALRYRFDSRISIQTLQRFNDQTGQMAAADSDDVGAYLSRAGGLAEKGSAEMLTAFFDTVESYLDHAEQELLARADEFSRLAQEYGGQGAVELASGIGHDMEISIRDFFRVVDEALAGLECSYVGEELQQPLMPVGEPVVIAVDQQVNPTIADSGIEDAKDSTVGVMA
jgi:hypothetical protein